MLTIFQFAPQQFLAGLRRFSKVSQLMRSPFFGNLKMMFPPGFFNYFWLEALGVSIFPFWMGFPPIKRVGSAKTTVNCPDPWCV